MNLTQTRLTCRPEGLVTLPFSTTCEESRSVSNNVRNRRLPRQLKQQATELAQRIASSQVWTSLDDNTRAAVCRAEWFRLIRDSAVDSHSTTHIHHIICTATAISSSQLPTSVSIHEKTIWLYPPLSFSGWETTRRNLPAGRMFNSDEFEQRKVILWDPPLEWSVKYIRSLFSFNKFPIENCIKIRRVGLYNDYRIELIFDTVDHASQALLTLSKVKFIDGRSLATSIRAGRCYNRRTEDRECLRHWHQRPLNRPNIPTDSYRTPQNNAHTSLSAHHSPPVNTISLSNSFHALSLETGNSETNSQDHPVSDSHCTGRGESYGSSDEDGSNVSNSATSSTSCTASRRSTDAQRRERSSSRRYLTVTTWNVDCLSRERLEQLRNLITDRTSHFNPDILALQEIKTAPCQDISIPGYMVHQKCRQEFNPARRSGGVALYVRKALKAVVTPVPDLDGNNTLWVKLSFPRRRPLYVCSHYGPVNTGSNPLESTVDIFHKHQRIIQRHLSSEADVIALGDYNARIGRPNHPAFGSFGEETSNGNGLLLRELVRSTGLVSLNARSAGVDHFTYVCGTSKSLIDYILVSPNLSHTANQACEAHVVTEAYCGTTHCPVSAKVPYPHHREPRAPLQRRLNVGRLRELTQREIDKGETDYIYSCALVGNLENSTRRISELLDSLNGAKPTQGQVDECLSLWYDSVISIDTRRELYKEFRNSTLDSEQSWEAVVRQDRIVKKLIKMRKRETWAGYCKTIERSLYERPKEFWRLASKLKVAPVKPQADSVTFPSDQEQDPCLGCEEHWRNYYDGVFNPPSSSRPDSSRSRVDEWLDNHPDSEQQTPTSPSHVEQDRAITMEEILVAMTSLTSSAPGKDKITKSVLTCVEDLTQVSNPSLDKWSFGPMVIALQPLLELIRVSETIPTAWRSQHLIPIPKPGKDSSQATNWRGIFLLSVAFKLYSRILLNRLQPIVEEKLHETQYYRPSRSITDCHFIVGELTRVTKVIKRPLYLASLDLSKAFDRIWREAL